MTVCVMRAPILLVCLALAACGPSGPEGEGPFVNSDLPPNLPPRFWAPVGWTWGVLELEGDPALRYGVSTPRGQPNGEVVILTGYGETAEGWFETVGDLVDANYTVWVVEAAGQGGSGRYRNPRNAGHAPNFDADVRGLQVLVGALVRPQSGSDLALIASGTAAPAVLRVSDRLEEPPGAIIFSGPVTPFDVDSLRGWRREDEPGLAPRLRAQSDWMTANPDLRMGRPERDWRRTYERAWDDFQREGERRTSNSVVTIITPGRDVTSCEGFSECRVVEISTSAPYHLSPDETRTPWLSAVVDALNAEHGL